MTKTFVVSYARTPIGKLSGSLASFPATLNGGAIALGHPIGMSGTRLVITMVEELNRQGGGLGAVALCGGGGQGDAALVKVA